MTSAPSNNKTGRRATGGGRTTPNAPNTTSAAGSARVAWYATQPVSSPARSAIDAPEEITARTERRPIRSKPATRGHGITRRLSGERRASAKVSATAIDRTRPIVRAPAPGRRNRATSKISGTARSASHGSTTIRTPREATEATTLYRSPEPASARMSHASPMSATTTRTQKAPTDDRSSDSAGVATDMLSRIASPHTRSYHESPRAPCGLDKWISAPVSRAKRDSKSTGGARKPAGSSERMSSATTAVPSMDGTGAVTYRWLKRGSSW